MELNQKTIEELKRLCWQAGDVFEREDLQYMGEEQTAEGINYHFFCCPNRNAYIQNEEGDWILDTDRFLDGDDYDYFDFIYLGGVWYLWRLDEGYKKGMIVLGEYTYKEEQ